MKTCVFYGSSTGVTEDIANRVSKLLSCDIFECSQIEKSKDYDLLILATSTWGEGDLQDDWDSALSKIKTTDFNEKKIALIGIGDQDSYGDTFVNGMKTLYDVTKSKGATFIGTTSTDGYSFSTSTAVENGMFLGLVIDEENQSDLTDDRIKNWLDSLK